MIRILYGENRRILSKFCRQAIADNNKSHPFERSFLIVPEQQKASMENVYFAEDSNRSLMLNEVVSFRRFAMRIIELSGSSSGHSVSAISQTLVLSWVLKDIAGELKSFGNATQKSSFLSFLEQSIGDLLRYEISEEEILDASKIAKEKGEERFSERLHDIYLIFRAYMERLDELVIVPSDLLLQDASLKLEELFTVLKRNKMNWEQLSFPFTEFSFLKKTRIWIHGFGISRQFTPQEMRLVQVLNQLCEDIVITIEADRIPDTDVDITKGPAHFQPGRAMLWQFRNHSYPIEKIQTPSADKENKEYVFQRFADSSDEIRWIAGEIKRIVYENIAELNDIGIVLLDPSLNASMQTALNELSIPFYANNDLQASDSALIRFMVSILRILSLGFSLEHVMPFLRSPYSALSIEQADTLENFFLARGIDKHAIWQDRRYAKDWLLPPSSGQQSDEVDVEDFVDEEELVSEADEQVDIGSYFLQLRDLSLREIRQLDMDLEEANTLAKACDAWKRFFVSLQLEETLEKRLDHLEKEKLTNEAEMESKSWNYLVELFQSFLNLQAKTDKTIQISKEEFLYFLEENLRQSIVQRIPANGSQVMLATSNQLAQEEKSILFLVSAEQSKFPGKGFGSGLLTTVDREKLHSYSQIQLPDNEKLRIYANASHIYSLLDLPEKMLYLSFSGSEKEESSPMKQLRQKLGQELYFYNAIHSLRDVILSDPMYAWLKQLDSEWKEENADEQTLYTELENFISENNPALYHSVKEDLAFRELKKSGELTIDETLISQFYDPDSSWSISQLERYSACPFSFFSYYVLRLKERSVWTPEASSYGTLLHKVFEISQRIISEYIEQNQGDREAGFSKFKETYLDNNIVDLFEMARVEEPVVSVYWESGENYGLLHKAKKAASATAYEMLDEYISQDLQWKPFAEEWVFGPEVDQNFIIEHEDEKISLRGRVDRVDIAETDDGQILARMIDYKSGRKRVNYDDLYYGLDLQLAIYLAAFEHLHGGVKTVDAAYAPLTFPQLHQSEARTPDTESISKHVKRELKLSAIDLDYDSLRALKERSLEHVKDRLSRIRKGAFSVEPKTTNVSSSPCKYCAFKSLCTIDKQEIAVRELTKLSQHEEAQELSGRNKSKALLIELLKGDIDG